MNPVIEGRAFHDQDLPADGSLVAGLTVRRCSFSACGLSLTESTDQRLTIRDIAVVDCRTKRVIVGPAVIDSVTIDGLRTDDPLFVWGAALRHTTLKGRIERLVFRRRIASVVASDAVHASFARVNTAFYSDVDWALDITEAEFTEVDLEGIPARLIRRDPATQVVVTKAKAMEGRWRALDLSRTWWGILLGAYANASGVGAGPQDAIVLAAPKRRKDFRHHLDGLKLLRDEGIAEPG